MKIGLISDTHIPYRANHIPKKFIDTFKSEKIDLIIHLGDINDETVLKDLEEIAETIAIKGNTDYINLPREKYIEIEGWKIFLFHSDVIHPRGDTKKIIDYVTKKVGKVDIILHGHTHIPRLIYDSGLIIINPGSATGVISGALSLVPKSVAILKLKDNNLDIRFIFENDFQQ